MNKTLLPFIAAPIAAAILMLVQPAHASVTSMQANGSYSLNGSTPTTQTSIDPTNTYVDVLSFPPIAGSSSAGLHSYGSNSGNFGSRSSGQGVYNVTGSYNIVETITNPGPTAVAATMNFNITPGLLLNTIGSPLTGSDYVASGVVFDIQANASSVWGSSGTLSTNASGTTFSQTGTNLYTYSNPTYYSIAGGPFSVGLGTIAAGGTMTMSYTLSSWANGQSSAGPGVWVPDQTFTVPDQWVNRCKGQTDVANAAGLPCPDHGVIFVPGSTVTVPGHWTPGAVSGSRGSSGDPFTIGADGLVHALGLGSADPFGVAIKISPIPEPSTTTLAGAGLGLVGWLARRRRTAQV